MKGARDLADGHAIASGASNPSVIVHRKHILTSVKRRVSRKTSRLKGGGYGGSLLRAQNAPGWVPIRRSFPYTSTADLPRTNFASHPWSIGGGGATDVQEALN